MEVFITMHSYAVGTDMESGNQYDLPPSVQKNIYGSRH